MKEAVGEGAGPDLAGSRDTEKRIRGAMHGTRVQHNPKSSNCQGASRRSDGHALKTAGITPGGLSGAPQGEDEPQGELIIGQKSAEGVVVVETSRGAVMSRVNEDTGRLTAAKGRTVGKPKGLQNAKDPIGRQAV